MTARKAGTAKAATSNKTDAETESFSFEVEVADPALLKVTRETKPNPLLSAVEKSIAMEKPLQISIPDAEKGKEAENLLRRAAKTLGCGLSMRNLGTHIVFQGKMVKRERKYTTAEVREWAREQGATDEMLFPRVQKDVREAFRKAHGIDKSTAE